MKVKVSVCSMRLKCSTFTIIHLLYPCSAGAFAKARSAEVKAMLRAVGKTTGSYHVYSGLPKHMRRRAMSHNTKRFPSKMRELANRMVKFRTGSDSSSNSATRPLTFSVTFLSSSGKRACSLSLKIRKKRQKRRAAKPGGGMEICCWSLTVGRGRTFGWSRTFGTPSASTW